MREKLRRVTYADIARIAAAFAVVLLHTAGIRAVKADVYSSDFFWAAAFDALARWSVPLFIMLSGMLFLKKERKTDIKRLWRKNISRLVTAFVFWSYLYNLYSAYISKGLKAEIFLSALKGMPQGAMHLWFMFIIAGLYVVTPCIKRMTDSMTKREAEYFLILNLILTFIPKTLSSFEIFEPFIKYLDKFEICYAAGYVGLFVAGWYIDRFEHKPAFRMCVYIGAIASYIYMLAMTVYSSRAVGELDERFMSFKSLSAYLMAFGALMLFKYALKDRSFKPRTVSNLANWSKYTFGVYLIHEMIINFVSGRGMQILPGCPYLGIPIEAALIFAVSFLAAGLIDLLPFGKYII